VKSNLKIITLLSGIGSRLSDYDKKNPIKPLKKIFKKTIIEWSIKSYHAMITNNLIKKEDLYFVILKDDEKKYLLSIKLKKIFGKKIKIIKLKKLTRGPAESALIALKKIKLKNKKIIINDCDHYFNSNALLNKVLEILKFNNFNQYCGIINTANTLTKKPEWSYLKFKKNKLIGIEEKDKKLAKLKSNGVVGSYFFFKSETFVKEASQMIKENDLKNQDEFYISRVYDRLIKKNKKFLIINAPYAFPLGKPSQVINFKKFYLKNKNLIYPEPKSYLFDLDGVLVLHDKGYHGHDQRYTYPFKPIKNNISFLKKKYENGDKIFITTARAQAEYYQIVKNLNKSMIPFHKLICDFSGGTRVIINDKKPNMKKYLSALAIETKRNDKINNNI
jgi:hypothetical protein